PEEGEIEALASYDIQAREPVAATVVGFLLLAVLTTMLFRGTGELQPPGQPVVAKLSEMPRKVDNVLRNHGLLKEGERAVVTEGRRTKDGPVVTDIRIEDAQGAHRYLPLDQWPEELSVKNPENLGFNLLRDHPGTIEIAGVILLMAMLGSVVLSRKQVQIDE